MKISDGSDRDAGTRERSGVAAVTEKKIVSLSIVPAFCSPWLQCNEQMNMPASSALTHVSNFIVGYATHRIIQESKAEFVITPLNIFVVDVVGAYVG